MRLRCLCGKNKLGGGTRRVKQRVPSPPALGPNLDEAEGHPIPSTRPLRPNLSRRPSQSSPHTPQIGRRVPSAPAAHGPNLGAQRVRSGGGSHTPPMPPSNSCPEGPTHLPVSLQPHPCLQTNSSPVVPHHRLRRFRPPAGAGAFPFPFPFCGWSDTGPLMYLELRVMVFPLRGPVVYSTCSMSRFPLSTCLSEPLRM
jgi:hypothetical protein